MNDNLQLIEQQNKTQKIVENIYIPEQSRRVVSPFMDLPGLIGLWYGGNCQRSTGDMPNIAPYISGASSQDLTYNGNPTFNYTANGVGYADLDGVGDYFSATDNTDLDISGTETQYANPGLTMGGWFRFPDATPAATGTVIGKWGVAGVRSYRIRLLSTGVIEVQISDDGTNTISVSGATLSDNIWYFIFIKFIASTLLSITINDTIYSSGVGILASLFNGAASFAIGANGDATATVEQDAALCCLCANALPDNVIQSLFQQTRSLYGV